MRLNFCKNVATKLMVLNARVGAVGSKQVDNPIHPVPLRMFLLVKVLKLSLCESARNMQDEDRAVKAQVVDDTEQTLKRLKPDYGSIEKTRATPKVKILAG